MKQSALICILSSLPFIGLAQNEWAPIGAIWHVNKAWYFNPLNDPLFDYYTVEVTGDTIVDGKNGRKVGDFITVQDGEQVFLWWQDTLRLIYDYSLEVGDSVSFSLLNCDHSAYPERFVVDSVNTIVVDNVPLKRFFTSSYYGPNQEFYYEYVYIQKIGTPDLPILDHAFCYYTGDHVPAWTRCYRDAEIYYRSDRFNVLGPNEACDYLSSVNVEQVFPFKLMPNPATEVARLELGEWGSRFKELSLQVVHPSGQIIYSDVIPALSQTFDIPVFAFSSGIYILKLVDLNGSTVGLQKLVVIE
jgi:hypothetical protein